MKKNKARKKIPTENETATLTKSARRCAACFGLNGDLEEKQGQIAHLDRDRTNDNETNLAFMCLPHHSNYDSTTSQHKNYTISEIRSHRTRLYEAIQAGDHHKTSKSVGGKGGSASVKGNNSEAIGGAGGESGIGSGGDGGHAEIIGDNSRARGGDGGNSAQHNGRGGRRTFSPGEQENGPTDMWKFGYGGPGANTPEYNRRLEMLTRIRKEYMSAFPCDVIFIEAGIDPVPTRWVNKRLEEMGETWGVRMLDGGYEILDPIK